MLILALYIHVLPAQNFINGSFENNTFPGKAIDITNASFNGNITGVFAFGPNGKMDVFNSVQSFPAQEGSWYIGLQGKKFDLLSLELDTELIQGKKYVLTYYDLSKKDGRRKHFLDFGLSLVNNDFGDPIYDTLTGTCYNHWMKYSLTFIAPDNGKFITIRLPEDDAWIAFDNFSLECAYEDLIDLGDDIVICQGQEAIFDIQMPGAIFRWQDGSGTMPYPVKVGGKYWLNVKAFNCIETDTIEVVVQNYPSFDLGADTAICEGQELTLGANIENAVYLWSNSSTSNEITIKETGSYWLKASLASCSYSDSIDVEIIQNPKVSLGNDTSLCEGQRFTISLDSGKATYKWMDGSTTNSVTVSESGIYCVEIISKDGCTITESIEVTFHKYPWPYLGKDTVICEGEILTIGLSENYPVQWSDGSSINEKSISEGGLYWVESVNNGCVASDTLQVTTIDCNPSIILPNVFTPNGDNLNDNWFPIYQNLVSDIDLKIYDRQGMLVFESKESHFEWGGNLPEKTPAAEAIYFYTLVYAESNGSQRTSHGTVTLLR